LATSRCSEHATDGAGPGAGERHRGQQPARRRRDRRHSYDLLARSAGNRDRSTLALWTLGAVSAGAGYASDQVSLAATFTMLAVAFVIGTAAGGRLWRDATAVTEVARPEERR